MKYRKCIWNTENILALHNKFKHLPWCYLLRRGHLSPWWGDIQCPETQSSSLPSDKGKFWQGRGVMSRGWTCWQLPPRAGCYLLPSFSEGEANWPTPFKKQTLHKCHKSLPCLLHSAATALGITRNHPFELYFILQPRVEEIYYFATYWGDNFSTSLVPETCLTPIPSTAFSQHLRLYPVSARFVCICADMHGKDVLPELVQFQNHNIPVIHQENLTEGQHGLPLSKPR